MWSKGIRIINSIIKLNLLKIGRSIWKIQIKKNGKIWLNSSKNFNGIKQNCRKLVIQWLIRRRKNKIISK